MMIVLRALFRTPEYSWRDRLDYFRGVFGSMRALWPQLMELDLFTRTPRLEVPAFFLLGRHDREAPPEVAARYAAALRAPRKVIVWFERSAHFMNVEEAGAFNAFFTERLPRELPAAWPPGATLPSP